MANVHRPKACDLDLWDSCMAKDHLLAARESGVAHQRSCIVTREAMPPEDLLRFVLAPDGAVVPDLARNLPGRGVWVTGRHAVLARAVERSLFSRGFKRQVQTPQGLVADVDSLLEKAALNALSLSRKAGVVVTGFRQVDAEIRSGRTGLVLHAIEAAPDGIRKLDQAIHAAAEQVNGDVAVKQIWHSSQMDLALGGHNVIHAAAIRGGAARALIARIEKLEIFRS